MKIVVDGLNFSYGSRRILSISHTSFKEGKAYGIVGKNGVGKTTFFKCLVNIITRYYGNIFIDGLEIRSHLHVLANVGIVLDDMNLYSNRTGLFNIKYFAGLRGNTRERTYELARELGIDVALNNKVSTYSLGMTKKLQLLISLMNDAEILIFDEPFRGLDAGTVDWFRNYLNELKQVGRTILISSHVQDDIESISDYVLVLENGNFETEFDLLDNTKEFIYKIEVENKEAFKCLLEDQSISFTEDKLWIQFIATEDVYRNIFKVAVNADIHFLQIKKEAPFAKFVK